MKIKKAHIEKLERLIAQIDGLHREIGALGKKSPNDGLNVFKLKFVNQVLSAVNEFLDKKYRPFGDFEVFEEDAVPSNSDVTFILAQYAEALELYRSDHIYEKYRSWYYEIEEAEGEEEGIRTAPPAALTRKRSAWPKT